MTGHRLKLPFVALLLLLSLTFILLHRTSADENDGMSAEDLAAEEEAARLVGEQAERDADEDIGDALDEEIDAARATIEDPNKHPLTNIPPPNPSVTVKTIVKGIDSSNDKIILGDEYRALIGFANGARTNQHVWGVMGSLNYDNKWDVYVQNFTYQIVNRTVSSGQELSLVYRFRPNERLDTRKFQMGLSLFYEARNSADDAIKSHAETFFNQTVTTVAGRGSGGGSYVMVIVTLLAALGAGGFYGYKMYGENGAAGGGEVKTNMPSSKQNNRDDWLEEHHQMVGARTRSKSPGRAAKNR